MMQDVAKTIIEQLETDWNLTDTLAKAQVTFRRDEPANLSTRFMPKKISIETAKFTVPYRKRTLNRSEVNEIVTLTVWFLVAPKTDAQITVINDKKQEVIDEIRRIIKLRQRSMTDIRLSFASQERHINSLDDESPNMRVIISIKCKYYT